MQDRLKGTGVEFQAIKLDPEFPITAPSHILRGEVSSDAPHVHDCFEIGYCFEGIGIFTIEDKILSYETGDAVIINQKEVHQAVSSFGKISTWSFLNADPTALLSGHIQSEGYPLETDSLCGHGFINVIKASEYPDICSGVRDIISEMRNQEQEYQAVVRSLFFILLIRLHRIVRQPLPEAFSSLKRGNVVRISPAIRYIADHFSRPLDLDLLAERCHLSTPHFRKVFRETTGMPPLEYLTNFRMKAALIMLKNSNHKIIEIAYSCGYSTLSSFNRTFKSTFGIPPSQWRKLDAEV